MKHILLGMLLFCGGGVYGSCLESSQTYYLYPGTDDFELLLKQYAYPSDGVWFRVEGGSRQYYVLNPSQSGTKSENDRWARVTHLTLTAYGSCGIYYDSYEHTKPQGLSLMHVHHFDPRG